MCQSPGTHRQCLRILVSSIRSSRRLRLILAFIVLECVNCLDAALGIGHQNVNYHTIVIFRRMHMNLIVRASITRNWLLALICFITANGDVGSCVCSISSSASLEKQSVALIVTLYQLIMCRRVCWFRTYRLDHRISP